MADIVQNLAIHTENLTKIFRDFWGHKRVVAVDALDLDIRMHEVYGLLGPNGSGKSTTIKLLLGLLYPTRGRAYVLGSPPGNVKINARIGFLPEDSHLYPFLNARETLDFYGRLFGLTRQQRRSRSESLLEMVGLSGVGGRLVGQFSKGMQRRIGLAQALINDPDLLILDEPTSGLDPIGTRQIKNLIQELGRRGKTVLLCSHLLADVEDVCDRIGILYGGKMQIEGSVADLLEQKEMTEIRTVRLPDEILEQIRQLIRRDQPSIPLEILTPRNRLEEFFLQTVSAAQAAAIETSGATAGSGVSDFLTDASETISRTEQVIEHLVHPAEWPVAEPSAAGSGLTEPVDPADPTGPSPSSSDQRKVLDSLVQVPAAAAEDENDHTQSSGSLTSPVAPAGPADAPAAPVKPASAGESVDRSLIEQLTRRRRQDSAAEPPESSSAAGDDPAVPKSPAPDEQT
ncbi:MAG: ABC transporter ATP-binding protein [Sedimentisphaerales bacterium]|nr:ABC transporter ATP-binding protein [Sedimentisphaerales bacterium]